ncbi:MAG: 3-isopropylmalate dehydratase large subunit [Deltaproteobacteria bacterium RBG_13_65_10]|nr:MAG: 3-isopropylmalate dehydratase large subunit [Deltaproteobacteria bacterium RBG_13_65_10]
MGMTITEKILAAHAGLDQIEPEQIVNCRLDLVLANDITAPLAIQAFRKVGAKDVFDKEKVVLVMSHFTPAKDIQSAEQVKVSREFARALGLRHFYEGGEAGIEHALLPELGLVIAGDCVLGADSHTCTYGGLGAFSTGVGSTDVAAAMITGETWFRVPETMKFHFEGRLQPWVEAKDLILTIIGEIGVDGALYRAMEFSGPALEGLEVSGRLTMANMAIEAGGKSGIFEPDVKTREFCSARSPRSGAYLKSDPDAKYAYQKTFDASAIEPVVAYPFSPENVHPISKAAASDIRIDQSVIGSCTNGRIEDLRTAARILQGQKVAPGVRLIIFPASPQAWKQALKEGLIDTFIEAGAIVSPSTCGPCLGGHMGVLAAEEVAISTTNRNFAGRMGHPKARAYLSNVAVAAASAVTGKISHPAEVVGKG